MAPLEILRWSLLASAQRPSFWLVAAAALTARPVVQLVTPLHFTSTELRGSTVSYEIAFMFSLAGALLAIPCLRELQPLTLRHRIAKRWSCEVPLVVVHAGGLGILSAWPSWIEPSTGSTALALAQVVTALFWAGVLGVLASLATPWSARAPALLAVAALMAIGIAGVPALPLIRGAASGASSLSIFAPAALAADFASIISLFVVAWCCESPLVRRS